MPIKDKQENVLSDGDFELQDISSFSQTSEDELDHIWQSHKVSESDFDLICKRTDYSKAVETPLLFSSHKVNLQSIENDLREAVLYDDTSLLRAVIKEGVDLDKPIYYHSPRNILHYYHRTPLFIALTENNYWVSKALLKAGANPNVAEENSKLTPLFPAIKNYAKSPSEQGLAIILMLLVHKADPKYFNNHRYYLTDPINYVSQHLQPIGANPFNYQHQDNNIAKLVQLLVSFGANVNSHGLVALHKKPSCTVRPLKWSFVLGLSQTMLLLIASGAELNLDITNLNMLSNQPKNKLDKHQMQRHTLILYKKALSAAPNHRIFAQNALDFIKKIEKAKFAVDEYIVSNIEKLIGQEDEIISVMKQKMLNSWLSIDTSQPKIKTLPAQPYAAKLKRNLDLSPPSSNAPPSNNNLSQLAPANKKIKLGQQYITPNYAKHNHSVFFSEATKFMSPSKDSLKKIVPVFIKEDRNDNKEENVDTVIYYQR